VRGIALLSNGKRATPRKCPARRFVCRWGSLSSLLVQLNSVTWPARSAGNDKDRSRRTILGGAFSLQQAGGDLAFERESRRGGIHVAPYRIPSLATGRPTHRTGGGRERFEIP